MQLVYAMTGLVAVKITELYFCLGGNLIFSPVVIFLNQNIYVLDTQKNRLHKDGPFEHLKHMLKLMDKP